MNEMIGTGYVGRLTEVLGGPCLVAVVKVESPLVFVALILISHDHQLLLVRLLPFLGDVPVNKNKK